MIERRKNKRIQRIFCSQIAYMFSGMCSERFVNDELNNERKHIYS